MRDERRERAMSAALAEVQARIAAAARAASRDPAAVTLAAVSKTHGAERVEELLRAGHRVFGENRVQEAQAKFPELKTRYPDLELHLIGPLQTNKARDAVALFDVIESVDRPRIAVELAREMARQGRHPACFVQVNTGEEEQSSRRGAGRGRRLHPRLHRGAQAAGGRRDVHPAGRSRSRRCTSRCWPRSPSATGSSRSAWA